MSNQISLTIPNDDPIALRAFGNALEEMAIAHGASLRLRTGIDMSVFANRSGIIQPLTDDTDQEALEEFTAEPADDDNDDAVGDDDTQLATNDTIDADGLPWDARIHSGNQERNADNTWRVRRRPKDLTPEQWAEQVAQVRDELFALMAIPVDPAVAGGDYSVEVPQCRDCDDTGKFYAMDDTPCACPAGDVYRTAAESPAAVFGAPEPVEVPTVAVEVPPAPPIADPVPPAPAPLPPVADPVPPAPAPLPTTGVPATLAELMTWLTSKAPSDDAGRAARLEQINDIVARHGLVTLGQLQKRLDLIPQVYADLVKELGQ